MVDIDSNKIIDVLESRELEDVSEWLRQYPNIELICRDGSIVYAKAISRALKDCIQVGDRFHILKNLFDYSKQYIKRAIPNKIDVTDKLKQSAYENNLKNKSISKYSFDTKWDLILETKRLREEGHTIAETSKILEIGTKTVANYSKIDDKQKSKYDNKSIYGAERYNRHRQKELLIDQVKSLKKQGNSIASISRELNLNRKTVERYIDTEGAYIHGSTGMKRASKLDPHKPRILELFKEDISSAAIYEKIRLDGYTGSDSLLRKFLNQFKKGLLLEGCIYKEFVKRKSLEQMIYKDINKINSLSEVDLNKVLYKYPKLGQVYSLIKEFKYLLLNGSEKDLVAWINENKLIDIKEINRFIAGLERDYDAVKNAIKYSYSNGLAEGSVNKIKVIKRIMYGKCSFELLRKKILLNSFN